MRTLILGASFNPDRFSHKALLKLVESGVEVFAIGLKKGSISSVLIRNDLFPIKNIHTITIYLSKKLQKTYYDYVIFLKPKRVLFNPGAENIEFSKILTEKGIYWENACTLVLLSTDQYQT